MLNKNFYDNREIEGSSSHLRNKILSILDLFNVEGDCYLDIGTGSGDFTIQMSNQINANEIYGVDISYNSVKTVKNKGIISSRVDLNVEELPFPDNFFDVITATDVIEHLTDSDNFLNESFRVLKPGGFFLVSSPNLSSWLSIISLIFGYLPPPYEVSFEHRIGKPFGDKINIPLAEKPVGHIKPYNLRALREHLIINGFDIVTTESTQLIEGKGFIAILGILDSFFSHFKIYSGGIIFLAKKRLT